MPGGDCDSHEFPADCCCVEVNEGVASMRLTALRSEYPAFLEPLSGVLEKSLGTVVLLG